MPFILYYKYIYLFPHFADVVGIVSDLSSETTAFSVSQSAQCRLFVWAPIKATTKPALDKDHPFRTTGSTYQS